MSSINEEAIIESWKRKSSPCLCMNYLHHSKNVRTRRHRMLDNCASSHHGCIYRYLQNVQINAVFFSVAQVIGWINIELKKNACMNSTLRVPNTNAIWQRSHKKVFFIALNMNFWFINLSHFHVLLKPHDYLLTINVVTSELLILTRNIYFTFIQICQILTVYIFNLLSKILILAAKQTK